MEASFQVEQVVNQGVDRGEFLQTSHAPDTEHRPLTHTNRGRRRHRYYISNRLISGGTDLTGWRLRDETGDRLTPTHTKRHGRRLRYYISNRLISGGTDPSGWRLPAVALEQAVANIIARHLSDLARSHRICAEPDLQLGDAVCSKAEGVAQRLRKGEHGLFANIAAKGQLAKGRIDLVLHGAELATKLSLKPDEIDPSTLHVHRPHPKATRRAQMQRYGQVHEPTLPQSF